MPHPLNDFPTHLWIDIVNDFSMRHRNPLMKILRHHQEVFDSKCDLESKYFQLQDSYRKLQAENQFLTNLINESDNEINK